MALRTIRLLGDEMLTKPCREVQEITPRIQELIGDMLETMYNADGVGLAAPQVGVLRQVVVIDIWQEGVKDPSAPQVNDEEETAEPADAEEAAEGTEPEPAEAEEMAETAESTEDSEPEDLEEFEEDEEEEEMEGPLIMINPVITRKEGEQTGDEGCLSYPGKVGRVTRPYEVTVIYFDENMDEYELDAEGLLARAICHEVDHLSGHMYVEFVEGEIHDVGYDAEEDEEDEESGEGEESKAAGAETAPGAKEAGERED